MSTLKPVVLFSALTLLLTGCGLQTTATPNLTTAHITGNVHGGEQPIFGGHVHIMVASTSGYAGAATALPLTGATGVDTYGSYIASDSSGNFDLTGKYVCVPNTLAYILATEGNPGLSKPSANNAAIALVAVLGTCPSATNYAGNIPNIFVNEASTVASAYALAQFASGPGNVGTSNNLLKGLSNAMTMAAAIVPAATGRSAGTITSSSGGYNFATHYPQTKLNALANITSACVNTDGATNGESSPGANDASPCYQLFTAATPPLGTAPTDTFTALLNIAHNPGNNVAALFNLGGGVGAAFQPTIAAQPNDWTLAANYSILTPNYHMTNVVASGTGLVYGVACGAGCDPFATLPDAFFRIGTGAQNLGAPVSGSTPQQLNNVAGIAFGSADGTNILFWGNNNADAENAGTLGALDQVTSLTATGGTYTNYPKGTYPSLGRFGGLAMNSIGSAWVASNDYGGLVNVNSTPTVTPGASNGNFGLAGVAINGDGSIWVSCFVSGSACKYGNTGTLLNSYPGIDQPQGVALDTNNHAWFVSNNTSTPTYRVFEVNTADGSITGGGAGYSSPHLGQVHNLAIDSNGNAWVPSCNAGCTSIPGTVSGDSDAVFVFAHGGALVSPMYGFIDDEGAANTDIGPNVFGLKAPVGAAIDESGNVWIADASYVLDDPGVTIFLGAASPVVTPIQRNLQVPYLAPAKRP